MSSLTDNEIDFIFADLEKKGLTIQGLREEITDHICCIIEPDIDNGTDFQTSYNSFLNRKSALAKRLFSQNNFGFNSDLRIYSALSANSSEKLTKQKRLRDIL